MQVEILHEKFNQYSHVHVFPYGLGGQPRDVVFQLGDIMNQGATEVKPDLQTNVKAGVPTTEQSRVEDIIPILRDWVPRDYKVFLTINCEGCEFEGMSEHPQTPSTHEPTTKLTHGGFPGLSAG